jgi:hypothetical protein
MANFSITHTGAIVSAGPEMKSAIQGAVIDLSGGAKPCQFGYAIPTPDAGMYDTGYVVTDSQTLISILQDSAATELEAASGMKPGELGAIVNGVYDCDCAKLMAMYAAYTRQQKVGDAYILSVSDVYNILARSYSLQGNINQTLMDSGYGGPITGYNAIPLMDGTSTYVPPSPNCGAGAKVINGNDLPPVGGLNLVGASEDDGESKWWLLGGVAAAGLAGYTVFRMMKRGRK